MIKKEILKEYFDVDSEELQRTLNDYPFTELLSAMNKYAKIQAIEFDKWKRGLFLIKEQKTEKWLINFSMNEWSLFAENDEQLYNLFLEHQLNNRGK